MASELTIRQANQEDVAAILAIDHVAAKSERRRQSIEGAVKEGRCQVACDGPQIIGFGILQYTFFECGFISLIYIAPAHRRRGIASLLIREFERICRTPKLFTSTNASNSPMQALLRKLGYTESGVIHNLDADDPEIVYLKRLQEKLT